MDSGPTVRVDAGCAVVCDDGVACTVDSCDATGTVCVFTPDDAACGGTMICDPAAGCEEPVACTGDAECDDGVFCNGAETCGAAGCEPGTPPVCDDGVVCTADTCDSATDACVSAPVDAMCDDGMVCNGVEVCDVASGCAPGTAVDCGDGVACTTDTCAEPTGTCTNVGADVDGDGYVAFGCLAGDDCADSDGAVNPGAGEVCDGIDNDCSGAADDGAGMTCVLGSGTATCTTTCGTTGSQTCDSACSLGPCNAATETCANGCDDDGDGAIDEGCGPVNDTCGGALVLSGASGTRSASFSGTSRTVTDCAGGAEIWYQITVPARSVLYLDTFGSTFDTKLSVRTSCGGISAQCEDDDCGMLQEQLVRLVTPGTYYVALHAFSSATTTGTASLRWQLLTAGSGTVTRITAAGTFAGTTSGAGLTSGSCGGSGPENLHYFTRCPSITSSVSATTCSLSSYDTLLYLRRGGDTQISCNDDACGLQSTVSGSAVGPGVFGIFVDGFGSSSGAYSVSVSGL